MYVYDMYLSCKIKWKIVGEIILKPSYTKYAGTHPWRCVCVYANYNDMLGDVFV